MYANTALAEEILERALAVAQAGDQALLSAIDELPAAIYITDPEGVVTYFNPACIAFTGRMPEIGRDRWCVTWKLFTLDGTFLPHDRCPMADAIRTGRPIRDVRAVAERPDGARVSFQPYPTPLLDARGQMVGAVNMLIDVTDEMQAEMLRGQAVRCRRLAFAVDDVQAADTLNLMASEYEAKAESLRSLA